MGDGVTVWPDGSVRGAIKAIVGGLTAGYLDQGGGGSWQAEGIIAIGGFAVGADSFVAGAGTGGRIHGGADIKVTDLIGEGDIVGVGSPRHTGLLG